MASLEERALAGAKKKKQKIKLFLNSGVGLQGELLAYDKHTIVLSGAYKRMPQYVSRALVSTFQILPDE